MSPDPQGTPYIETPDTHSPPEKGSGLYCFLDSARPCDADCSAFLVAQPDGKDYEGQQWAKCMLLVNLHKAGKHVVALATQGDSLLKHLRVAKADATRAGSVVR